MTASNALSKIGIIKESVIGTTPATPTLDSQRFSSANFSLTKPELLDDSKADTRQYLYTKTGNKTVGGSIDGGFAHDNYDTLLESAMYNAWDTDELIMGDTIVSLSIEEGQSDINQYKINRGCVVNGFTLNAPVSGLATISFDILGLSQAASGSSVSASAYTAQASRQPMTHCGGTILENGTAIGVVTDLSFSMTNNLETVHTWGECDPHSLVPARVDVTGTMSVLFENSTLINKFVNDTESSLEFTMEDNDGNTMTFELPNIKYTGADVPIATGSGLRVITMPFRALFDATAGSTLVITRS